MFANLHLKIVVLAMVAFGLMLMGGAASADPDPNCVPPDPNDSAGPTQGGKNPQASDLAHCVHTNAVLGGAAGNSPVVENKWELPDMDSTTAGVQYTSSKTGTDPCIAVPNSSPVVYSNTPCIDANGNDVPNKNTGHPGHFHHDADPCKKAALGCQTTVVPNVDDKPEKRMVEIWAIVSDSTGGVGAIATVQAIVTHDPNCEATTIPACDPVGGTKKITSPTHPVQLTKRSCEELFLGEKGTPDPTTGVIDVSIKGETHPNSPIHAAVNSGGLQHAKLTQEDCAQDEWDAYAGHFLLNNEQPWGKYGVCVQAIDTSSNLGERCNKFLVQNVVAFKIDFVKVDFGSITAGIAKTVSPGNVTNTGNADACLSVLFGKMEGKAFQNIIDDFGSELKGETLTLVADASQQFVTPIESKGVNKIRFTIAPPAPLSPDTYQGRVDLSVKKCPVAG